MKITCLMSLFFLISCSDGLRTRETICKTVDGKNATCSSTLDQQALEDEVIENLYIASVDVPVTVTSSKIIIEEEAYASEFEQGKEKCILKVNEITFNYDINGNKLTLSDGLKNTNYYR